MSASEPVPRRAGDDRVLRVTRWVAALILPFLGVAAAILLVAPGRTGELFAWAISPPLSAALLAAAYVGGIWYFTGVVLSRTWHAVKHGVAPVVVFAGALLVATLLHLDRFSSNLSFIAWIVLYVTTPFVIAGLGRAQRRSDPGTADPDDVILPGPLRIVLAVAGALALVAGGAMFLAPGAVAPVWAWDLTPLTAQVTGAVLSLTGVVNLAMVRDPRWSAFRVLFGAQLTSLAVILGSLLVHAGDLHPDRPATTAFLALVVSAFLLYGAVTAWAEITRRRARRTVEAARRPPA